MRITNEQREKYSKMAVEYIEALPEGSNEVYDTWLGDEDFDINVFQDEYDGDFKATLYAVENGSTVTEDWVRLFAFTFKDGVVQKKEVRNEN